MELMWTNRLGVAYAGVVATWTRVFVGSAVSFAGSDDLHLADAIVKMMTQGINLHADHTATLGFMYFGYLRHFDPLTLLVFVWTELSSRNIRTISIFYRSSKHERNRLGSLTFNIHNKNLNRLIVRIL